MAVDRAFRFGVHHAIPTNAAEWVAKARRYEELGFSTLFVADHFNEQFAPIVPMTAAACATSTLRVGCLVFDNDYRHPLVLAKEMATLDHISGGRVEVGLGAGWMATDYEQAGIPFDPPRVRVDRFEEGVRVIKALLTGEVVDFAGEHYTITGHRPYPASLQRPHPPIVLPGGGPRTLRIASREADIIGVHPARLSNETWAEQNLADASAVAVDGKVRLIREIAGARYDEIELQTVVPFVVVTDDRDGTAEAIASGLPAAPGVGVSAENVLSSPYVLIGNEDQMCATLIERRERWDLSYFVFNPDAVDAIAPVVARLGGT